MRLIDKQKAIVFFNENITLFRYFINGYKFKLVFCGIVHLGIKSL